MKRIVLLLSSLAILLLVSCEKKENAKINIESFFKASKNDQSWIATRSWADFSEIENKFYISGFKRDSTGYLEENLRFDFFLSDISASDTIKRFNCRWDYIIGGDAVSDSYLTDTTSNNFIHISSVNFFRKQISGTFQIKLIRDSFRSDKGEIIQYKEGQFKLNFTEDK